MLCFILFVFVSLLIFILFPRAAECGFPPAQNNLALMMKRGLGSTPDNEETVKWYTKAAEQDYVISQNNLGFLYKVGNGVEQNIPEAVRWFSRAAALGYPSAQKNIGDLYRSGVGLGIDFDKAKDYYTLAAKQNCAYAMNSLGVIYQQEYPGWIPDNETAFYWYQKAAAENIAASQYNMYLMAMNREIPGSSEWSEEECDFWSNNYLSKAVHHKSPSVMGMLEYGKKLMVEGPFQNIDEGVLWILKSALCGLSEAMDILENSSLGLRQLLYLGVLEMNNDSAFSFVERGKQALLLFIKDNLNALEQDFHFQKSINMKILILHGIIPHLSNLSKKLFLKSIYNEMEMMICDSIKSLGQYIASPLAISETLNVKPYADISPSKVSFNILHEVYLNYHPLNPPSTPILNNKKYSEREQLKEIKQGFVGVILDDCNLPIFAHRKILSKDHYFKTLLCGNMRESSQDTIRIQDISTSTFHLYLKYLYGLDIGEFIDGDSLMQSVFTAHRFGWTDFHNSLCHCIETLILDWEQVSSVYSDALVYNDTVLAESCLSFGFHNLGDLLDIKTRQSGQLDIDPVCLEAITEYSIKKFRSIIS